MTGRMTYSEAAEYIRIDRSTLRGMVHRRTIPHIRISARVVVFDREAIDRWLAERAVPVEGRP